MRRKANHTLIHMTDKNVNHSDRPHAEFGPSSLKHINNCAGWESRGGTNSAAEMGTRIHEAVEVRDPSALHDEKEVAIYEKLIQDMDGAIEFLKNHTGVEPVVHQEIRLEMKLDGCETFGTADIVAVAGSCAVLHDHKTGIGKVDAPPENWQSTAYAVGVFQTFPEVDTIFASFSMPQRNELLVGEYTRNKLAEYIQNLSNAINKASVVRPQWANGGTPDWEQLEISNSCQYCMHKDRCPALGHTAQEVATRYRPELLPSGSIASSDIEDPEILARLYTIATIVEKWAEGIRHRAVEMAKQGHELPGLKLKSLGSRKIIVDKAGFLEYASARGLSPFDIIELSDVPLAKIRDHYASKAPKGKKTAWARDFEDGMQAERLLDKGAERYTLTQE